MFNMSLMLMSSIVTLMFTQINHPLAVGLTVLIETLIVCLITGLSTQTYWFSYILFLVFLGGLLVLFIYVTSLASNEMFSLSPSSFAIFISLMTISLSMLYFSPIVFIPL